MQNRENFVMVRKLILIDPKHPKLGIWAQSLQKKIKYKIPDFPNFVMVDRFRWFRNFFWLFWLVLCRFGWFPFILARSGL